MRSSFIRGHLLLKVIFIETFLTLVWSDELMFKIWGRFDQWLLRYSNFIFWSHLSIEVIFHWMSSSFKPFLTLVWSYELMFKILGRSDQWLLRYSNFHILRSSSIRGRLPLKVFCIEASFDFGTVPWAYVKNLRKI